MNKKTKSGRILIADAGKDQVVYARYNGAARVKRDGSGGIKFKRLTYTWYLEGSPIAMGMRPAVKLVSGEHTITLVVNNGREDSEPSHVVITVIEPVEVECKMFPPNKKMFKKKPEIMASLDMPPGITKSQINFNQPFRLYPGGAEVVHHYNMQWRKHKTPIIRIYAFFHIDSLTRASFRGGAVELSVAGQLKTGQCFYGCDTLELSDHSERGSSVSVKQVLEF